MLPLSLSRAMLTLLALHSRRQLPGGNSVGKGPRRPRYLPSLHALLPSRMDDDALMSVVESTGQGGRRR